VPAQVTGRCIFVLLPRYGCASRGISKAGR